MAKKVIMIGSNHAGTFAQTFINSNFKKDVKVTAYDANSNTSFLGCGMAIWIGGVIDKPDGLFYSSPELLRKSGSNVYTEHEVTDVNFNKKEITVLDLKTGKEKIDNYDELIIAVGSWPIQPKLPGIDLENILIAKRFQHAEECMNICKNKDIESVAVVGGGYIGIELAEAFQVQGKKTTLITDGKILNRYYDKGFVDQMRDRLIKNGIHLVENEKVKSFEGVDGKVKKITTNKGTYNADVVLMSVGVKANTGFLRDTKLKMNEKGVIEVNQKQQTNIKGVYAIGDCATVINNVNGQKSHIGLATNAVRTGIIASLNAGGVEVSMNGVQGSNAIHIYGLTMASTGFSQETAKAMGYETDSVEHEDNLRPEFMPTNAKVRIKVVWDKKTLKILGAQIMSEEDITLAIHMFSLAIEQGYTIDKLATLDLFFLPHFNKPNNFITKAGILALGKILKY